MVNHNESLGVEAYKIGKAVSFTEPASICERISKLSSSYILFGVFME